MPTRTEADFRNGSQTLIGSLYEATIEGVRDYYRDHPLVNHKHRTTTRRSIVRDYIVYRMRAAFDKARGGEVLDKRGTTFFGINSQFLGLVRKLDEEFAVALNKTQAAMDFQTNESAPALPADGFVGATNIYIGYIPDRNDPMSPRVYVVCPNDTGYEWAMELEQAESGVVSAIAFQPAPGADPENLVDVKKIAEMPSKASEGDE